MGRGVHVGGPVLLLAVLAVAGALLTGSSSDVVGDSPADAVVAGDGTVFLLIKDRGAVVKATAAAATVDARAPLEGAGDDLVLVQHGEGALVHNRDTGTIQAVSPSGTDIRDGARVAADSEVMAGGGQAYVIEPDGAIGLLSEDGREVTDELTLSSELTGAVVDDDGTLWVVDLGSGELVEVDDGELLSRTLLNSQDPGLTVGLTGNAPFVVDSERAKLIDEWGFPHPLPVDPGARLLPALLADSGSVAWVASPTTGTLFGVDLADGSVLPPVDLGDPDDHLGRPLVVDGTVYVTNLSRGVAVLVDAAVGGVPRDEVSIMPGGGRFVLRASDGYVVFDDEGGPRAGVISPDGDVALLDKNAEDVDTPPTTTTSTTSTTSTTFDHLDHLDHLDPGLVVLLDALLGRHLVR